MIKKRKKLLFAFIIVIIAVLMFSVVGVISVYLAGPQPQIVYPTPSDEAAMDIAAPEAIQDALNAAGTLTITDENGDIVDVTIGTGN